MVETPIVLEQIAGNGVVERTLTLVFLGCEAMPPYGPYEHTAKLFLDLFHRALIEVGGPVTIIKLLVYKTSQGEFPQSFVYDKCDGVIIPGSFNSAYDEDPWIVQLKNVIQEELVAKEMPTLGVCFGHQLYAHSFPEGNATKCPAGAQAGCQKTELTDEGQRYLGHIKVDQSDGGVLEGVHMFYTHGDMVEKLPTTADSLGGTDWTPIQAAIYYSNSKKTKPIAITFQAHPEFGSTVEVGLEKTLNPIVEMMAKREDIDHGSVESIKIDSTKKFSGVQQISTQVLIAAGKQLGWFP